MVWESASQSRRYGFDPRGATEPMHHNYWACAREPRCCNFWSFEHSRACAPQQEKPVAAAEEQPSITATRESLCAATKTQRGQTWITINKPLKIKNKIGVIYWLNINVSCTYSTLLCVCVCVCVCVCYVVLFLLGNFGSSLILLQAVFETLPHLLSTP